MVAIPFVSGLTDGNVIRYDVPTTGFTAAKADNAPNSEVFGVIENLDSSISKILSSTSVRYIYIYTTPIASSS
jgi:hypothetical protein